jgi:hypothetical protein
MGCRHHDARLAKIHRTCSVDDLSRLLKIHKNTVRDWLKQGALHGICTDHNRIIYRRVNPQKLEAVRGDPAVTVTQATVRILGTPDIIPRDDGWFEILPEGSEPFPSRQFAHDVWDRTRHHDLWVRQ